MSDIFNDIDEDLRREKMKQAGRRALPWISAAVVLLVLGAAGWTGYEWYSHSESTEASVKYQSAITLAQQSKFTEADALFVELSNESSSGYGILSRFRHAAIDAALTPRKGSAKFDALAGDTNLPQDLRDLARIRSAQLMLEKGSYSEIESRIQPLAESPASAWRHAAREILALSAWKHGNEEAARRWGTLVLSDFSAPSGTRGRAQLVLDLVGEAKTGSVTTPASAPQNAPVAPSAP